MNVIEIEGRLAHHYDGAGVHFDGNGHYAEREIPGGGKEGFFGAFLDQQFLPGYYEILDRRMRDRGVIDITHVAQVSSVIERIFVPLIRSGQAGAIKVTGEIPRTIAVGLPDGYWERFERLYDKQESLKNSPHPLVRAFCQSEQRFAKDPDADITFADLTMAEVSQLVKEQFRIGEADMAHENGVERYELFREGGLVVAVEYGSLIETKKDITLMRVKIIDEATEEQIFHLDVGEFPKTVQRVVRDKRVIHATRKHSCHAELTERDGHLYYRLPLESIQVMREADTIYNRELWSLHELTARSVRIACSHPVESLINFEGVLPQLDRDSMFAMQRIFRDNRRKRGEIPSEILFSVIKELIVGFDFDHMQAAQMFIDSGISVPGTDSLSPEDRNALLRSDSYSVELIDGNKVPHNERDETYVRRQRELYVRGRKPHGERHYHGLKRFIEALVELNKLPESALEVDEWEAFFDLFVEKKSPQIEIFGSQALIHGADGILYRLERDDGQSVSRDAVEALAVSVADDLPHRPEGIDEITDVIQLMRERATGDMAKAIEISLKLRGKRKSRSGERLEGASAINRVYSVARLYLIIKANPSGLTPMQMESLYQRVHGRFRRHPFREAFLNLKQLGLVRKFEMASVTAHRKVERPVDYYFILPEGTNIHKLPELIRRNTDELTWIYRRLLKTTHLKFNADIPDLEQVVEVLGNFGMTLEVLESLTNIDFEELTAEGVITNELVFYAQLVRETLRRFYIDKYLEGESVPVVLKLTFESAGFREQVHRARELLVAN